MKRKIKLSESDLHNIIKESVTKAINEINNSQLKKKYINKIYKHINDLTSNIYRDDDWRMVSIIFDRIEHVIGNDGELDIRVENGGYWKQIGEFPNYKEYKFKITLLNNIEINGSLKCHAAGTMTDVFDRYDITVTMW